MVREAVHSYLYKSDTTETKVNPRGVATDRNRQFLGLWQCLWDFLL